MQRIHPSGKKNWWRTTSPEPVSTDNRGVNWGGPMGSGCWVAQQGRWTGLTHKSFDIDKRASYLTP